MSKKQENEKDISFSEITLSNFYSDNKKEIMIVCDVCGNKIDNPNILGLCDNCNFVYNDKLYSKNFCLDCKMKITTIETRVDNYLMSVKKCRECGKVFSENTIYAPIFVRETENNRIFWLYLLLTFIFMLIPLVFSLLNSKIFPPIAVP